ncbi:MAG: ABC transporter ATP-binding protein [Nitriliruptorales bacterium]|nr:ABC transporter ATP-binding protein [Nitriliruptorales bacterium]
MNGAETHERTGNLLVELARAARTAPALTRGLGLTLVFAAIGTAGNLVVPIAVQRILDQQILSSGPISMPAVAGLLGFAALGLVLAAVANRTALRRLVVAASEGLAQLRTATFRHIHDLSVLHVEAERRGTLVSRVTSDIAAINDFLEWGGVGMIIGSAQIALTMAVMLAYEWRLAVLVAVGAATYGVMLLIFQRVLRRAHDRVRTRVGESLAAISEAIVGLPTIRAFGAERRSMDRLGGALDRQFRAELRVSVLGAVMFSSAELFAASLTAAVVAAGVWFGAGWTLTAGQLVAFLFLVTLFIDPVQTLVEVMDAAQSAAAGVRRVLEVLDTPKEVADPVDGVALSPGPIDVAFQAVRFRYPTGEDVLHDVSVSLPAGSRVAVVGETGSGKTTFAKLLVRLLDPAAGRILLSGVAVDRIAFASLRSRVAFVPQAGFLFEGTIAENVRYGRPGASDQEIRRAFEELELADWMGQQPAGLATEVGERGGRLSAGERQLVALVRAWIADPDLLVLDEATSAVDPYLDVRLRRAMEHLTAGRTSVTVAHRLSTAQVADVVLVFDDGRIVESGTHTELVERGEVYGRLWADWSRTAAAH